MYIGDNAIEMPELEIGNAGALAALVMPQLPECPDLLVRQMLGAALREFCRETDACTVEVFVPREAMGRGRCGETLLGACAAPSGMMVCTVLGVEAGGREVGGWKVVGESAPAISVPGWVCGCRGAKVRFSVCPRAGGEACPQWFLDRYAEAITAGAMHKLLSMGGKPWSDFGRAAQYGAEYANAVAEASYRRLCGGAVDGSGANMMPSEGAFI